MDIRRATADDGPEIVSELLIPSFKEDEKIDPAFNRLDDEVLAEAGCDYWLEDDSRALFVAVEDDELIGHISGNEISEPPIYIRDSRVQIDGLYVKERSRRSGVASDLIRRMEEWADSRDCEYLGVAVHQDNEAARTLYERQFTLKFLSYRRKVDLEKF